MGFLPKRLVVSGLLAGALGTIAGAYPNTAGPASVKPHAAATLTISDATFQLAPSVALSIDATSTAATRVLVELFYGGSPVRDPFVADVAAGAFSLRVPLPPPLRRGGYVVRLSSTSGDAPVQRDVELIAPARGVVYRAWFTHPPSTTPITRLRSSAIGNPTRRRLEAHFAFAVLPQGGRITVHWYTPRLRYAGRQKRPQAVINTWLFVTGDLVGLRPGIWGVVLRVNNQRLAEARLRVVRG